MEKNGTIDIILPCYNPLAGWENYVIDRFNQLQDAFPSLAFTLIVVNDFSSRDIALEIEKIRSKVADFVYAEQFQNQGKGSTLRKGSALGKSALQVVTDIDFPYEHESMVKIIEGLLTGNDVVIGVREGKYYEKVPKFRIAVSKVARWMLKNMLKLPVTDTQCGLKGFNEKGRTVFLSTRIDRYLFDMEFIYLLHNRHDIPVFTQEVQLREGVVFSRLNIRVMLSEMFNFLRILFRR